MQREKRGKCNGWEGSLGWSNIWENWVERFGKLAGLGKGDTTVEIVW